jgi:hypothetical protein
MAETLMKPDPVAPPPIKFPKDRASDVNAAMDELFRLFHDHYPVLVDDNPREWTFRLRWPEDPLWYVDPQLVDQARRHFDCSLVDLARFVEDRSTKNVTFVFSMFHSRALLAPALAYHRHSIENFTHIIHVDDHDDLLPPLLESRRGSLFDPISSVMIDLASPESVTAAIDRGVIHKGSFLACYVLARPNGSIWHVSDRLKENASWLLPVSIDEDLGGRRLAVSALDFKPEFQVASWRLDETPAYPKSLSDAGAVWLDVDLDGFCNRYDGDSDRRDVTATDVEERVLRQRIDDFLISLSAARWKTQVRAVSVAASPGFFPSEYWDYALPTVCDGIAAALGLR